MPERFIDKIKRKHREWKIHMLKKIIRKAVQKWDDLSYTSFMAYSWGRDEITSYNVLAQRCYPDHNIYGTKITYYEEKKNEID